MKLLISSIAVVVLIASLSMAEDTTSKCKGTTIKVVGKCFMLHGRLGMYNGGHTFWIWRPETKHKYWVEGELPGEIEGGLDWDHFYWGDFEACPTTQFKKGFAQGICVKRVEKLKKTNRTDG